MEAILRREISTGQVSITRVPECPSAVQTRRNNSVLRERLARSAITSLQAHAVIACVVKQRGFLRGAAGAPDGRIAAIGEDVAHCVTGAARRRGTWCIDLVHTGREGDVAAVGRDETTDVEIVRANIAVDDDHAEQRDAVVHSDLLAVAANVGHC